ncbi:unnamed protein product [Heligmosomoides polygyrus]|uniref:DUF5641 domain-containing protein n=1 Tax=Heligmosomoides polygyrus TaxID=6339 RepID=A0A183FQA5_HELPZ|nr:unnamed protein product [Heligmosomoides polygyrus]
MLVDETQSRGQWELGIIAQLHRGEDDMVRSATVRRPNGTTIKRSINMLILLELTVTDDFIETLRSENEESNPSPTGNTACIRKQPPRAVKKCVRFSDDPDIIVNLRISAAASLRCFSQPSQFSDS